MTAYYIVLHQKVIYVILTFYIFFLLRSYHTSAPLIYTFNNSAPAISIAGTHKLRLPNMITYTNQVTRGPYQYK